FGLPSLALPYWFPHLLSRIFDRLKPDCYHVSKTNNSQVSRPTAEGYKHTLESLSAFFLLFLFPLPMQTAYDDKLSNYSIVAISFDILGITRTISRPDCSNQSIINVL